MEEGQDADTQRLRERAQQAARVAQCKPEHMTTKELAAYLGHHGALQSGPRALQNWRVRQLQTGLAVVRTRGAPIPMEEAPLVIHVDAKRFPIPQTYLFQVPLDVVNAHILPHLDDEALLAMVLVSRVFYAPCRRHLMLRTSRMFGARKGAREGATPLALACYYHYLRLLRGRDGPSTGPEGPNGQKRQKGETPFHHHKISASALRAATHKSIVAKQLNISQRPFERTYLQGEEELLKIICLSIKINGSIDALKRLPAYREQQAMALERQKRFIADGMAARLADVNAVLVKQGLRDYPTMMLQPHPDKGAVFLPDMACAMRLALGTDAYRSTKRTVRGYVNMTSGSNDPAMVFSFDSPHIAIVRNAMTTLATHTVRPPKGSDMRVWLPALVRHLVGQRISNVKHIFSADFLSTTWPSSGLLLCLWRTLVDGPAVHIWQLSEKYIYNAEEIHKLVAAQEDGTILLHSTLHMALIFRQCSGWVVHGTSQLNK